MEVRVVASWKIYRLFSEEDVGSSSHIKVIMISVDISYRLLV